MIRIAICIMGELVEIVDSLENKISKLLHKIELLNHTNTKLKEEVYSLREEQRTNKNALIDWEEKYHSLKLASTMLGSNTNKTEAKLKINALIRELDLCIAQLAE